MDYEEKLLTALVEKYRASKKDRGTNVIARRTKLTPSGLYKNYSRNDGDMEQIEAVNQAILACSQKGFVTYEKEKFCSEIRSDSACCTSSDERSRRLICGPAISALGSQPRSHS